MLSIMNTQIEWSIDPRCIEKSYVWTTNVKGQFQNKDEKDITFVKVAVEFVLKNKIFKVVENVFQC